MPEARQMDRTTARFAFEGALTDMHLHNYLNGAYHEAQLHHLSPPSALEWRIPAFSVPAKVRALIKSEEIVGGVKKRIVIAREALEQFRSELDREVTSRIGHTPDKPYGHLPAGIVVSRHTKDGYASSWEYTFNPYTLGIQLLDEYEQFIDKVMRSRLVPFTQVSRIHQKAKSYYNASHLISSFFGW